MKLHDQYAPRGVKFVALTDESDDSLDEIHRFVEKLDVPWPIGYGAGATIRKLKVPGYPTTFLIGRSGKVVWNSFETGTLEGAIRNAL